MCTITSAVHVVYWGDCTAAKLIIESRKMQNQTGFSVSIYYLMILVFLPLKFIIVFSNFCDIINIFIDYITKIGCNLWLQYVYCKRTLTSVKSRNVHLGVHLSTLIIAGHQQSYNEIDRYFR